MDIIRRQSYVCGEQDARLPHEHEKLRLYLAFQSPTDLMSIDSRDDTKINWRLH